MEGEEHEYVRKEEYDRLLQENKELRNSLEYALKNSIDDGECYYCGKKTNSLSGNPSEWSVRLVHSDEPGVSKHHHAGCIMALLRIFDKKPEISEEE